MKLTAREFLATKIRHDIPALAGIPALLQADGLSAAEHIYADYVRATLEPEKYFRIPYYGPENAWAKPGESEADIAARLARGEVVSCGFAHAFPDGKILWEANPTPNGYREWTWQLNRHHEWRVLGHLYRETGDEQYARLFRDLFLSWREQTECPDNDSARYTTHSWRTIEIGIRMTKIWHYALHAFVRSPEMDDHFLCEFFASMWENGQRVRAYPTNGNWLVMEMTGLYHIGLLYPWLVDAEAWKNYAISRMESELEVQIYPDSFQYELTTNYHGVVVLNYIYALDITRAMEKTLPADFLAMLERAFDLYPRLAQPNFRLPDLNDGAPADASRMCELALSLFPEREDYRYLATRRAEGVPPEKDTVLPYSGMAVLRDGWGEEDQWAFFESAPFGRGHQHEDKLNFLLYAYGRDLLRDTGNYAYDGSAMRKYVLSTRSHNTVLVDGRDQNTRAHYTWEQGDIRRLSDLTASLGEDCDVLGGIFTAGYGSQCIPVTHRRTVVKVKHHPLGLKTFYLIIDRLASEDGQSHGYDVNWQLEDVPVTVCSGGKQYARGDHARADAAVAWGDCTRVTADYGDGITLTLLSCASLLLRRGSREPFMGWRTPNIPAPSVAFHDAGEAKRIVTLLYPSDDGCPIEAIRYVNTVEDRCVTVCTADGTWNYTES